MNGKSTRILIVKYPTVYILLKANMKYVGETKRILKFRFAEHRGYVNNNDDTATGEHFKMPVHSLSDMTVTVLKKVKTSDEMYRKECKKYFIGQFNTYYRGLNRQP